MYFHFQVSRSESEDEDPDIYVKREALEPQIVSNLKK